jgi:hypothetical protein
VCWPESWRSGPPTRPGLYTSGSGPRAKLDPSLVEALLPPPEARWGLASLGLEEGGLDEIATLVGSEVDPLTDVESRMLVGLPA